VYAIKYYFKPFFLLALSNPTKGMGPREHLQTPIAYQYCPKHIVAIGERNGYVENSAFAA
jgi:hypothetical protein